MNYFKDCKTQQDVKRVYREWAMKLHPDYGGKKEDMIELTKQYEKWIKPSPFAQSSQMDEEEFYKNFTESNEDFMNFYNPFGNYRKHEGYKYSNQSTMWNEYKKQQNDPRLADYERMKSENLHMKTHHNPLLNMIFDLEKENESLKKKLLSVTKRLERLKKKIKN